VPGRRRAVRGIRHRGGYRNGDGLPPDWAFGNGTFVLNRHVNVCVDPGPAGTRVVDFSLDELKATCEMQKIPDARDLAHFCNDIGFERMQGGFGLGASALPEGIGR